MDVKLIACTTDRDGTEFAAASSGLAALKTEGGRRLTLLIEVLTGQMPLLEDSTLLHLIWTMGVGLATCSSPQGTMGRGWTGRMGCTC